jgi:hypothetical protein
MKYKDFFKEDMLSGGKGDNKKTSDFDPEQVALGLKVEMEHTKDKKIAMEIVKDHLSENPNYYSELKNAGLADELKECPVVGQKSVTVDKQTIPPIVYSKIENKPTEETGCVGITNDVNKTDTESPAKDPTPTNHFTGGIGSTPSNPDIIQKQSDSEEFKNPPIQNVLQSIIPNDISIDITEGKKILDKMMEDSKKTRDQNKVCLNRENSVPVAGDPDKDDVFVKGKRWTIKWDK